VTDVHHNETLTYPDKRFSGKYQEITRFCSGSEVQRCVKVQQAYKFKQHPERPGRRAIERAGADIERFRLGSIGGDF
jgi:hypothetical protein